MSCFLDVSDRKDQGPVISGNKFCGLLYVDQVREFLRRKRNPPVVIKPTGALRVKTVANDVMKLLAQCRKSGRETLVVYPDVCNLRNFYG
ncbi:MAG: hypothetical protein HYU64_18815 [Armatimonadetes bacterium]|nr:hypothetical protein [Armatimonadota bacterium]